MIAAYIKLHLYSCNSSDFGVGSATAGLVELILLNYTRSTNYMMDPSLMEQKLSSASALNFAWKPQHQLEIYGTPLIAYANPAASVCG
jgi:hypothetical protein